MHYLLFIVGALAFVVGFLILVASKSAIQEIEAFILFLIGAVFVSGAGVIEAVVRLRKAVTDTAPGSRREGYK